MKEEFIPQLFLLVDILISAILGFCIGLERKKRFKEAGIRTHTLVCVGACLLMIVSTHGFGPDADTARVAAQIVSGVGFLGAGIIIYRKQEIKGLTTAAGVWVPVSSALCPRTLSSPTRVTATWLPSVWPRRFTPPPATRTSP